MTGSAGGSPANKHVASMAGQRPALPSALPPDRSYHSRGYLPHIEGAEYQMITYRLNDALPSEVIRRLQGLSDYHLRQQIETTLDIGLGQCWLAKPAIARIVIDNWRHFDNLRYRLVAFVVMPNHIHVLIEVFSGVSLSRIVQSWKSYTAKRSIEFLTMAGQRPATPFWQPEYWDRYIRDQHHYAAAIEYIHQNPVKAGLVKQAAYWPWSSAYVNQQ